MKKIFIAFVFCLISFTGLAQITYEASYNVQPLLKYFKYTSPKWMVRPTFTDVYLYNLNHSFYKHITVPPQNPTNCSFVYLSEDLFDNDSTNLEYLISTPVTIGNIFVKIYREDGTLLFVRDSAVMGGTWTAAGTNDYSGGLVVTDSGTKMVLAIQTPSYSHSEIYSLPGSFPCFNPCDENFVGIHEPFSNNYQLNNPYPNPSSSQTNIPIELPPGINESEIVLYDLAGNEIKRYKVDRTFSHLILSTAELAAGSYYYQVQTAKANSSGKKLIVIK